MRFATAINCMDGRVQIPVIRFVQQRLGVEYVDMITEPGPNLILAQRADGRSVASILRRVGLSVERHNSVGIAIVGHHDCAGNPASREEQVSHIKAAVELLRCHWQETETIGLWVDENWQVYEIY